MDITSIILIVVAAAMSAADLILGIIGLVKKNLIIGIIGTSLSGVTLLLGCFWAWWQILFALAGLTLGILAIVFSCLKKKKSRR